MIKTQSRIRGCTFDVILVMSIDPRLLDTLSELFANISLEGLSKTSKLRFGKIPINKQLRANINDPATIVLGILSLDRSWSVRLIPSKLIPAVFTNAVAVRPPASAKPDNPSNAAMLLMPVKLDIALKSPSKSINSLEKPENGGIALIEATPINIQIDIAGSFLNRPPSLSMLKVLVEKWMAPAVKKSNPLKIECAKS